MSVPSPAPRVPRAAHPRGPASPAAALATAGLILLTFCAAPQAARSQNPADAPDAIEQVIITGRSDSLIGVSDTASEGTVGSIQLETRTLARPGELLETVPGVIITQHSGAGKANQFFLRGFNLDHGTDFATSVNGVPVNLRTHGHGQGYTDLNFTIPELVERIDYQKGVYYAERGDFSSAGAADMTYFRSLPAPIAKLELGSDGFGRSLFARSGELAGGQWLGALELFHDDGPWDEPQDYRKLNAVARYTSGDAERGWSALASAYVGRWNATDQIPARARNLPGFGRFQAIDESDGGDSRKITLQNQWHWRDAGGETTVNLYGFYQELHLFGNLSYFVTSPDGDQVEQVDERWVGGLDARHRWDGSLGRLDAEHTLGLQLRGDRIRNGLYQTVDRHRAPKTQWPEDGGGTLPTEVRSDRVREASAGAFWQSEIHVSDRLRAVVGARVDAFDFDVNGSDSRNSGSERDVIASPKASLVFGPWNQTELYASWGLGFHSNDARGVVGPDRAEPLVRTQGAELGLRTTWLADLHSSVSLWWIESDSELIFVGDSGETEASRPSRRVGIELANYWTPTEWLSVDADFSLSRARFRDSSPDGREIPGAIESVVALGVAVHDLDGWFGGLRLRYFGERPLIEDDSVRSDATLLLSAQLGYQLSSGWRLRAEVFNLLNRRDNEIDYFYESRLPGEAGPVGDLHYHPAAPISARISLEAQF